MVVGLNALGIIFSYSLTITVIYAGSSLTNEAKATAANFSKFMNEFVESENDKLDFIYLMSHLRSRNLNVENFLFVINWKILLAVSETD